MHVRPKIIWICFASLALAGLIVNFGNPGPKCSVMNAGAQDGLVSSVAKATHNSQFTNCALPQVFGIDGGANTQVARYTNVDIAQLMTALNYRLTANVCTNISEDIQKAFGVSGHFEGFWTDQGGQMDCPSDESNQAPVLAATPGRTVFLVWH